MGNWWTTQWPLRRPERLLRDVLHRPHDGFLDLGLRDAQLAARLPVHARVAPSYVQEFHELRTLVLQRLHHRLLGVR